MRMESARAKKRIAGFNFPAHIRAVCEDMVARIPELAHIDMSRVAIGLSQARKAGPYGVHASLTPMRFEEGRLAGKRRGRFYKSQRLRDADGREMLYILTFCVPRFTDADLREKLITIIHELWHISPAFDGDLRRHDGRCYAHTGSRAHYDHSMEQLVDRWLALGAPPCLFGFLNWNLAELQQMYGRVYGIRYSRPKLMPISASEAHRMNGELPRRRAS